MNDYDDEIKVMCSRWGIDYSPLGKSVPCIEKSGDERFDEIRRDLARTMNAVYALVNYTHGMHVRLRRALARPPELPGEE
ncbi:MAG TPA: hypothetical protein VGQ65_09790 [Thermoanaerobaculia bacterium]|jgi:hypothetical protein|nr:hypothetical protein [Thermoanaerobaculia bacterium]